MSRGHLPRVVYQPVYNAYEDELIGDVRARAGNHGLPPFPDFFEMEFFLLSLYTSIFGDIGLWVGVPCASSALAVPISPLSLAANRRCACTGR